MRGQITPVTAVLLTGIIVALLGVAYMWGAPLIEKRTIITQYETLEDFVLRVDEAVTDIANNRAGTRTLDLPAGLMQVVPDGFEDSDNNSILFQTVVGQRMLFEDSPVPIQTANLAETGRYGIDRPRVITLQGSLVETGYRLQFKIHYRNLTTVGRTFRISLNRDRDLDSGTQQITISYDRSEADTTLINIDLI